MASRGNEIRVAKEPLGMKVTEVTSIPRTDFEAGLGRELKAIGASETEANSYVAGVQHGRLTPLRKTVSPGMFPS